MTGMEGEDIQNDTEKAYRSGHFTARYAESISTLHMKSFIFDLSS